MSNIYIPDHIFFDNKLSNQSKILYGILLRYADDNNHIETNSFELADIMNCNMKTINKCIKELEDCKVIFHNKLV